MWRAFWAVTKAIGAIQSWATFVIFVSAALASVLAFANGLPGHEVLFWGSAVLGVSAFAARNLLPLFESIAGYFGDRREGIAVANQLDRMASVDHKEIGLPDAARLWADLAGDPDCSIERNVKFRKLKQAVNQRLIRNAAINPLNTEAPFGAPGTTASRRTLVPVTELARFFRRAGWREIRQ